MISYASTKAFINTFATDLRCLAAPMGVDVITVAPGFIKSRMTDKMRSQDSTMPGFELESAQGMASAMVNSVEKGGIGLVSWPWRQSIVMYALQGMYHHSLRHLLSLSCQVSTLFAILLVVGLPSRQNFPERKLPRPWFCDTSWTHRHSLYNLRRILYIRVI